MNDPNDDAQYVDELLPGSTGIWRITTATAGSTHVLDLDAGTATRFPGPGSSPTINDCERPLRTLDACRVGERGRWTMHTDGWSESVDFYWHVTSVILRIEKVIPSDGEVSEEAAAAAADNTQPARAAGQPTAIVGSHLPQPSQGGGFGHFPAGVWAACRG